jgi:Sigma 54 modulation protein / S30EA ribosomal protein
MACAPGLAPLRAERELYGVCDTTFTPSKETISWPVDWSFPMSALRRNRKVQMQTSLQVAFQGCEPSDPVRASIEREFERLETHDHRITSGRVTVIGPGDHHRSGAGFQIHILLTLTPNENIVVSHSPSDDGRHEHAEIAVKDAFAAARRRVDDVRQKH